MAGQGWLARKPDTSVAGFARAGNCNTSGEETLMDKSVDDEWFRRELEKEDEERPDIFLTPYRGLPTMRAFFSQAFLRPLRLEA